MAFPHLLKPQTIKPDMRVSLFLKYFSFFSVTDWLNEPKTTKTNEILSSAKKSQF